MRTVMVVFLLSACTDSPATRPPIDLAGPVQQTNPEPPPISDGGPPPIFDGGPPPPDGAPPTPPKEAFEACIGKADGAACDFTFMGMHVTGHCHSPDPQKPRVCAPQMPGH